MRSKFDEQLQELHKEMITMGEKIVSSISQAIEALTKQDVALAKRIMEGDAQIDHLQKKIENIHIDYKTNRKDIVTFLENNSYMF